MSHFVFVATAVCRVMAGSSLLSVSAGNTNSRIHNGFRLLACRRLSIRSPYFHLSFKGNEETATYVLRSTLHKVPMTSGVDF